MEYAIATRNTLLKKKPKQSSSLSSLEVTKVAKGKKYLVKKYLYVGENHYEIELSHNAGTWFIYDTSGKDSHWDCSWEDTQENEIEGDISCNKNKAAIIYDTPNKIDWSNPNIYISKYFQVKEVTKGDSRRIPRSGSPEEKNILSLAKELDEVREFWDSPLIVTSWFRPSRRMGYKFDINSSVGGSYYSQHQYGKGIDIYPLNGNLRELQNLCLRRWRGGVGKGVPKGFVHLDSRSGRAWLKGSPTAVWNY